MTSTSSKTFFVNFQVLQQNKNFENLSAIVVSVNPVRDWIDFVVTVAYYTASCIGDFLEPILRSSLTCKQDKLKIIFIRSLCSFKI